jgi:hypothetical protein
MKHLVQHWSINWVFHEALGTTLEHYIFSYSIALTYGWSYKLIIKTLRQTDASLSCRFEFYEGIVRSSFGKFITTGLMDDASDATVQFIEQVVLKNVAPESTVDPNVFR